MLEIDGAAIATEEYSVWIAALGIFWLERRAKKNGLKRQYPRRVRLGMRSALSVPHFVLEYFGNCSVPKNGVLLAAMDIAANHKI